MANAKLVFNKTLHYMLKYAKKYDIDVIENRNALEEKVLTIINKVPKMLTVQDKNKCNIGMIACEFGLEKVVLKALENYDASIQQDKAGMNIGMHAAFWGLEEATLKALDNSKASIQQCDTFYPEGFDSNRTWMKTNDPRHRNIVWKGLNIGMFAVKGHLRRASLKALDNPYASTQTDENKQNIGMMAAQNKLQDVVIKALKNKKAALQQDFHSKMNMGMYAAYFGLEEAALRALDDEQVSTQTSSEGLNIGMIAAKAKLSNVVKKACMYDSVREQKTPSGKTMLDIAQENGLNIDAKKYEEKMSDVLDDIYNNIFK